MQVLAPTRKSYAFVQELNGSPDDVFALLCPVRECDWIEGWNPSLVISASGVAEPGCVFVTPDGHTLAGEPREAIWVITAHEPQSRRVAMTKVSPDFLVTRLWITVNAGTTPRASRADVRYEYTALGPEGEAFVQTRTSATWMDFMRDWERALNEHLQARLETDGVTVSRTG